MANAPKLTPEELLSMLVFNLQQSAMVAMGKLKNPVTGKVIVLCVVLAAPALKSNGSQCSSVG